MSALGRLIAVALATAATAFRMKTKARQVYGEVAGLYTWGSPATARPGLTNLRGNDPCFPGLRSVTVTNLRMDIITQLARVVFYEHPMMDLGELNTWTNVSTTIACSAEAAEQPNWLIGDLTLHMPWKYTFILGANKTFIYEMTIIGCWLANLKDFPIVGEQVKAGIEALGWRMVARAKASASEGGLLGGDQYSIFAQHPETLECVVTFQATLSLGDVLVDMDARPVDFCDISGTKVHNGFRHHLRTMVRGEWQELIRPHLPKCSKVHIAGMSLGGAMAELFSACVQRAPANDEDFSTLSWTPGQPGQLPYL